MIQDNDFQNFISLDCDRLSFISNYLEKNNLQTSVFYTGQKKHIYVNFPKNQYNPIFRIKTVIAHYDRVPGSAGANDNSFAVFFLLNWAIKLSKSPSFHNIRLIFTDGEETKNGLKDQGAYEVAALFRKLNLDKDDIFVFDCMGRGNVPVLSETNLQKNISKDFAKSFSILEERTAKLLSSSSDKWITLPTSYSDNAGFLASGIPAVAITMLPSHETESYMKLLHKTKVKHIEDLFSNKHKEDFLKLYPRTWLYINSEKDSLETITPEESGPVFERILDNLSKMKTLA